MINNFQQQKVAILRIIHGVDLSASTVKASSHREEILSMDIHSKEILNRATSMKLFILEITLWMIMEDFSNSLSLWIVLLLRLVTFTFRSCGEQVLMLSPNTHLLIFIFQLNGLTIAVHVSIARPLWLTAGLHCVFYARAKMCMFAETPIHLDSF